MAPNTWQFLTTSIHNPRTGSHILLESSLVTTARKMSVKLTPSVNFINFICTRFLYKCRTLNVHLTKKKLAKRHSYEKFAHKMSVRLTPRVRGLTWTLLRTGSLRRLFYHKFLISWQRLKWIRINVFKHSIDLSNKLSLLTTNFLKFLFSCWIERE